jgi:hypothetical protein
MPKPLFGRRPCGIFSDDFAFSTTLNSSSMVTRYNQIVDDIENKFVSGQCASVQTPSLQISPVAITNFLVSDGNGGYLPSDHDYTIKAMAGTQPLANQSIAISTTLGTLNWQGMSGNSITAMSDTNGEVFVTISHNQAGAAEIVASASVNLPAGTRIDPGTTTQKIVLSGDKTFTLRATAQKEWVPGSALAIKKFHDIDHNGIQSDDEPLIDWQVKYRETGGSFTTIALGTDGQVVIGG